MSDNASDVTEILRRSDSCGLAVDMQRCFSMMRMLVGDMKPYKQSLTCSIKEADGSVFECLLPFETLGEKEFRVQSPKVRQNK